MKKVRISFGSTTKTVVLLSVGLLPSCVTKDLNYSTVSTPASLRLEWAGGGLHYDRVNFASGDKIGDVERTLEGAKGPLLLDPGDHLLGFRYYGNRGGFGRTLRMSEIGMVKARLTGGRNYIVRSSATESSVRFSISDESSGRLVGQSEPVPTHLLEIRPPAPLPLPPVMLQ